MKRVFVILIFCICIGKAYGTQVDTFLIKTRLAGLKSSISMDFNEDMLRFLIPLLENNDNKSSDLIYQASKYLPYIEKVVKEKKMPHVLCYLPYVITRYVNESNANDGRVGIWNMPYTVARKYDLIMNSYIDERYDVATSTESAMDYLVDLKHEFNDWQLAVLAFCTSPTNVLQHIYKAENGKTYAGIECDLSPSEKRFINELTAASYLFSFYKEKDINIKVKYYYKPYLADTIDIFRKMSFQHIAAKTGIDQTDLHLLNPIYKLETVPYNEAPHSLLIPIGYKTKFDSLLQNYPNLEAMRPLTDAPTILHDSDIVRRPPVAAGAAGAAKKAAVYYTVKSGDNLYGIADLFDCTANDLKRWNKITRNYLIAGQNMVFYVPLVQKAKYLKMNTLNAKQKKVLIYQD